jgi:hypothetical protein
MRAHKLKRQAKYKKNLKDRTTKKKIIKKNLKIKPLALL